MNTRDRLSEEFAHWLFEAGEIEALRDRARLAKQNAHDDTEYVQLLELCDVINEAYRGWSRADEAFQKLIVRVVKERRRQ